MEWQTILGLSAPTGMLAFAVWRFARLEVSVKHQHRCQHLLVQAVSRLNLRTKKLTETLERHVQEGG